MLTGLDAIGPAQDLVVPPQFVVVVNVTSLRPPRSSGQAEERPSERPRPRTTPARTARAPRSRSGVRVPVPVRTTAASDVTGISPLNSPVRSAPRRSMAPNQAMNTTAVTAIVR
jgi:hypothetical protein